MACDCNCTFTAWVCGEQHLVPPDGDGNIAVFFEDRIVDYVTVEPPEAPDTNVDPANPGVIYVNTFARNGDGELTHRSLCGTWAQIGAPNTTVTGPTIEKVCYTPTWGFPATFASNQGQWLVQGADQMAGFTCSNIETTFSVVEAQRADSYSSISGDTNLDWGAAPWYPYPTAEGASGQILADLNPPASNERDVVRMRFAYSAGFVSAASNVTFEFTAESPGGGNIGVTAWHPGTNTNLDVISCSGNQGAISTYQRIATIGTSTMTQPTDFIFVAALPTTDPNDPAWIDPTEVELVISAVNDSGSEETISGFGVRAVGTAADACYSWNNLQGLAGWLTTNDPQGNAWFPEGSSVCSNVPIGTGSTYGVIADSSLVDITPTVT